MDLSSKIDRTFAFAGSQLRHLIETQPDYFPVYTQNGKWRHDGPAWTRWCEGFLAGQLWLLYQRTSRNLFGAKRPSDCSRR